jgi:hypothetical protein
MPAIGSPALAVPVYKASVRISAARFSGCKRKRARIGLGLR